jgi:hypothetical protein
MAAGVTWNYITYAVGHPAAQRTAGTGNQRAVI